MTIFLTAISFLKVPYVQKNDFFPNDICLSYVQCSTEETRRQILKKNLLCGRILAIRSRIKYKQKITNKKMEFEIFLRLPHKIDLFS